jgi:hypothetical protein
MALRISDSIRITKRLRIGASIGTNGRPRVWLTEKLGPFRITESTSGRRKRSK